MKFLLVEDSMRERDLLNYSNNNTLYKLKKLNPTAKESTLQRILSNPLSMTSGSDIKVYWRCPHCKSDYPQRISSRYKSPNNSSCPDCMENATSASEIIVFKYLADVINTNKNDPRFAKTEVHRRVKNVFGDNPNKEIDISLHNIDGDDWGIEYDGYFWHKDTVDADIYKDELCKEKGLKLIRIREKGLPKYNSTDNVFFIYLDKDSIDYIEIVKNILDILLQGDTEGIVYPKCREEDYLRFSKNKIALITHNPEASLATKKPELEYEYNNAKFGSTPLNTVPYDSIDASCKTAFIWFKCSGCGEVFGVTPSFVNGWDGKDCRFHGDKLIYVTDVEKEELIPFAGQITHKNKLVDEINDIKTEANIKIEDPRKYGIIYRDADRNEIKIYNKAYIERYRDEVNKSLY